MTPTACLPAGTPNPFVEQLLSLHQLGLVSPSPQIHPALQPVRTPLQTDQWEVLLHQHPDPQLTDWLICGLKEGFRIGFDRQQKLRSATSNVQGTSDHPDVVSAYLQSERERQTLLGPFEKQSMPHIHVSKFGIIPKSHQPGKWRLIVDLSSPAGWSINDGIPSELCSLSYIRMEHVVQRLIDLGPSAQMAKFDIKSAYRLIPVHPQDRYLLGMCWDGKLYVDAALPFGLRSAPKIFTAVADALEWIFHTQGVENVWHYLDDFITVGPPGSSECQANISTMVELCKRLGVPLAEEKLVDACTCLTFLGIEIDTVLGVLRLPAEKLSRFKSTVTQWVGKRTCTKRELLSLIGQLQHASVVVRPGRPFLRRMINLSKSVGKLTHHVRINHQARSDIMWWNVFLETWNGVSLLSMAGRREPDTSFASDASGSWGCGAYWAHTWFQLAWSDATALQGKNIATQELLPIVLAAAVWGRRWTGLHVQCLCDNEAVVAVINSRSCKDGDMLYLLRSLFFFEAEFQFSLVAAHIPGNQNTLADALSRNNLPLFLQLSSQEVSGPTSLPAPLLELLAIQRQTGYQQPGGRSSKIF